MVVWHNVDTITHRVILDDRSIDTGNLAQARSAHRHLPIGDYFKMFPGISIDPDIRFGKPCITGTRIDVATLVGAVAAGETVETVAEEYALTVEQVRSALSYAAHVAAHLPPAVRQAS
jgi:uncharacterized protein (DUF433 family)